MAKIDLKDIDFQVYDMPEVPYGVWGAALNISVEAVQEVFPIATKDQALEAAGAELGQDTFIERQLDPRKVKGFTEGQDWYDGKLVTARADDTLIGILTAYKNVSGRGRTLKHRTGFHEYIHVREVAVVPEFQERGVARALGFLASREFPPSRTVAAYFYWGTPKVPEMAQRFGFGVPVLWKPDHKVADGLEADLYRITGNNAQIRDRLVKQSDARIALSEVLRRMRQQSQ